VPTPRSPRDSGEKDIAAAEVHTAMNKLRIVAIGGFGWEIAHTAATRRPPISLHTMVPRTRGYAYDVGVWDSSIVQGPFSVAPYQNLTLRFANFCVAV
jgi:hypothetical protein